MAVQIVKRLTLDDVIVVDTDIHAHEMPATLAPYVEPAWRPAVQSLATVAHRYLDMPGWCPKGAARQPGAGLPSPRGNREEIVWDAAQMRRELDAFSIDVGIIFPDHFLKLAALPNASYAVALVRAYHRWLRAEWIDADNDLYAVLIAPPQDPAAAVAEIGRYSDDHRFVGVYLPVCENYPLWGHRKYHPILAAAERAGLPVLLHAVSGLSTRFPYNVEQFQTTISTHTVSHTFAMMANLMSLMENAVPARFPALKVVFCEAGLTWVPFLRLRLDKEFNENRHQWPFYDRRPSDYIRGFYFQTQPVEEPEDRRDLVDLIRIYDGEDTTLFSSDWPHHDFDHPRAVFDLPLSEPARRKIMGENALRLFKTIRVPAKYRADLPEFAGR